MAESVLVVDHPLVALRLSTMRDERTSRADFRASLAELATLLVYEATRNLPTKTVRINTPVQETNGIELIDAPLLVPVLRAGLGMAESAQRLLPEAQIGFVGLARNEETHEPRAYLESLPATLIDRDVIVLDPMLATGGSLVACLDMLAGRGASNITVVCALAAPEGINRVLSKHPGVRIVTASVDERLNDQAYIVPGLGDAGDRQFGAV